MFDSKVIVREYRDGAVSVHARKDDGNCTITVHESWANSRPDVNSPVYQRIRNGELVNVYVHVSNLSRAEARRGKELLELSFSRQGMNVVHTIR